jgi:hypothetical protein
VIGTCAHQTTRWLGVEMVLETRVDPLLRGRTSTPIEPSLPRFDHRTIVSRSEALIHFTQGANDGLLELQAAAKWVVVSTIPFFCRVQLDEHANFTLIAPTLVFDGKATGWQSHSLSRLACR